MGMDTISVKYAKLFKLDIFIHHYLDKNGLFFDSLPPATKLLQLGKYRLGDWMEITPTDATKRAMAGLGWNFKPTATGFLVSTATLPGNAARAAVPPSPNLVLEFEMVANRPDFGQFSAFPLPGKIAGKRARYLFDTSVTSSENAASFPTLALLPPAFSNAITYGPGEMVRSGNNRFVAKKKTQGVATSNNQNWLPVTEPFSFANSSQLISAEGLDIRPSAFGLIRIHCGGSVGNFSLFNGKDLASPNFNIRLRNHPAN